jgi:hypothetical protein
LLGQTFINHFTHRIDNDRLVLSTVETTEKPPANPSATTKKRPARPRR